MQKAPFSFHCRICYERLNLTDRPPVVLPCGHTYICQQCSQRLTRCMECRTRIVPKAVTNTASANGAKPAVAAEAHPASVYPRESYRARQQRLYRQQQQQKYSMTNQSPQARKDAVLAAVTQESPPPILPKNIVLMSLMEAAQQKHGVRDEDDEGVGYESGDDDAQVLDGIKSLGSACGTYVVKAKEGLWVYDALPPPTDAATPSAATATTAATSISDDDDPKSMSGSSNAIHRCRSASSADPPGLSPSKENNPPKAQSMKFLVPTDMQRSKTNDGNRKRGNNNSSTSTVNQNHMNNSHRHAGLKKQLFASKAIEKLEYGDEVQVVCLVDSNTVAQLARGMGFVRIVNHSSSSSSSDSALCTNRSNDQEEVLVKVGEASDDACRMEGIIHSIGEEKKETKGRIAHLTRLEKTVHLELRQFLKREALEIQEQQRKKRERQLLELDKKVLSFGSNASTNNKINTSSVVMELLEEDDMFETTTYPSTPPNMVELTPSSAVSGSETPISPPGRYRYNMAAGERDDGVRESAPDFETYPTKVQTQATGVSWEEHFDNGCDLFFCATMPLCAGPSAAASVATPHVQSSSSIVADIPHLHRNHSIGEGSNRSNGDGDASTAGSSFLGGFGVDFATGLSGHMGAGRQQRRKQGAPYKKQVRMMSEHDGAAHVRRKRGSVYYESSSSVVSVGDATKASVATL